MHRKNAIKLVLVAASLAMAGCGGSDRSFTDDTVGDSATDVPPGPASDGSADSAMDAPRPDAPSGDVAADAGSVDTGSDVHEEVNCSTTPPPTISTSGPTMICPGRPVTLTSSAAASYLWSEGSTTQAIAVSTAGTYRVTTTDNRGCMATSAPTMVSLYPAPAVPTITAGGPTRFCMGGSVMLTASSGASYLWSTGATTQSIVVTDTGNYTVTTTNIDGCPATSAPTAVTRIVPPPGSQVFNYTGAAAPFTVPECVTSIRVDAYGAQGGNGTFYLGGLGGRVQATLTVVPNTSLSVVVGGAGVGPTLGGTPGFNGGGQGNTNPASDSSAGGGASDIRVTPFGIGNRILVAGAGGGAGFNCGTTTGMPDHGGAGGGLTGQQYPSLCTPMGAGGGGTQTAGGVGGVSGANQAGSGGLGFGGMGQPTNGSTVNTEGGGGGGGYYGGGGGLYGGGGGGSSFVTASGSSAITHTQGVRAGNGMVTISW